MRLTLNDVREEVGVYAMKSCTTDGRIPLYVNLAQEELHNAVEQYVGKRARYRLCVTQNCITWPREIETIEKMSICRSPVGVRNFWFEFLDYGTGILGLDGNGSCYNITPDRMDACTFNDIEDNPKFIRVYTDKSEAAGAEILFQGGDGFGKQVRTSHDGAWINGEYIGISNVSPQTSTHLFRTIDAVVKPTTNGYLSIYSFDPDTNEEEFLALYAPGETRPCYRRSFVPNRHDNNVDDQTTAVEIIAIRRFIPALLDDDFLLIPNKGAIKDMVMSILYGEGNDPQQAEIYKMRAIKKLQEQYHTWAGTAPVRVMNFGRGAYTAAGITNPT
jgi:hypothetical protein